MSTKMLLQVLSAAAIGSALVALSYIGFHGLALLARSAATSLYAKRIGDATLRG